MPNSNETHGINKLNLVLAFLIAFSAWIYVVYNVDPKITRTYSDVSIQLAGEDVLERNDLAVSKTSLDSISVTIEGRRTDLNDITSEDIKVTADVSDTGKGENTLALAVVAPNNTTVKTQDNNSVTVTVEDRITKTVDAVAVFEGETTEEPLVTEQSKEKVKVSGAESNVKHVANAQLALDVTKVSNKAKTFSTSPVAVNSAGKEVSRVEVEPAKISVTAVNGTTKTVALKVNVNNPDSDGFQRTYKTPQTITIKGLAADLKKVEAIETETVDLSNITKSQDIEMEYDLPDGIYIANASKGLRLSVTVTPFSKKTIDIPAESIQVNNLEEGLTANVTSGVTVSVTGTETQINSVSAGNFSVSADVTGLTAGTHTVSVSLSNNANVKSATLNTSAVTINIE